MSLKQAWLWCTEFDYRCARGRQSDQTTADDNVYRVEALVEEKTPLKKHLRGQHFITDAEVQQAVLL
ncbi:hypothetical protein TNCV_4415581 [Trichonephila clavipes]|uniref:Uncharacterized protein n=1 Tax=Trichonephila clavipes TaxID=2585209 RepID=A0A8X6S4G1_TRICX|nr:hypothetical protein TNCV_4415581 [Trichonephila clavipes]